MSTNSNTEHNVAYYVEKCLESEKLSNLQVSVTGNSEKGDGFVGDIIFVHAEGTAENGETKQFNLVLKCGKKDEKLRDSAPVKLAFEREIELYTKILPAFKKFSESRKVEPFSSYPKCYATFFDKDGEYLVLENLKKLNYDLHNRKQTMDLPHLELTLKEYGKYHALSFAMRDQNPEAYRKLTENRRDVFKNFLNTGIVEHTVKLYNEALDLLIKLDKLEVHKKCAKLAEEIEYIFVEMGEESADEFAVILHGDCWNNNFMYKYKDGDKKSPQEVSIIDWQISREASPVFDLSYFIYSCCSKETLQQHFHHLLETYYSSFASYLRELGSDPEKLFPYQTLQEKWLKYSKFGIAIGTMVFRFALCDKDDVPDTYDFQDMATLIDQLEGNNQELVNSRVIGILEHYASCSFK